MAPPKDDRNSSEESDDESEEIEEEEEGQDRPATTVHGRGGGKGSRPLVPPTATESRKRLFELLERRIGGVTAAMDGGAGSGSNSSRRMMYGELPIKNAAKKAKLLTDLKSQFDDWHSRLRSNFSVLLYGFGSKRGLLDEFARLLAGPRNRGDAAVLVFHGYNPRCTAREVVGGVAAALMQRTYRGLGGGGGGGGSAAAAATTTAMAGPAATGGGGGAPAVLRALVEDIRGEPLNRHAFVVIHNIDGPGLRGDVSLLSALAACPQVHVIASIDHALAPLLWDSADAARFRWQHINATTFQPYLAEISGAQSVLMSAFKSGVVTAGAGTVLRSLVLGAQEVFKVLAEHLLEDEECEGVAFAHLCRMCRERYLVRDERVLRQHLVEFVDHQLVRLRPASDDSGELLTIPMTRTDIQAVLEDLRAARGE
ncbi:origin recognition complex subunit 2 [Volvox carteri f. nagariensis]|uniref:Origin recognition complex subunit 2 n=1 Tax=Volvox carteri f. nagariensis TaxID=3068 RepID=D8UBL4_VOLCA|nr:origin recognition complex subunit 2 [Volvox carteri f. nagariensis]EFJ42788.1 origin recognition complex subunit 2 [Volvox carteri f. nagariensis]|eukprot:XP_002956048.1 origin recognition complex subunit 2 [Volvox carteri f. nagariensis]